MRWLFGLLLLANLVLFLWPNATPTARDRVPASVPATVPGVPPLELVGERAAAQPAAAQEESPRPTAESSAAPTPVSAPEPVAPPAPAPTPVASAGEPTGAAPDAAEEKPPAAPDVQAEQEGSCTRLGPFRAEDRARSAARYLAERRVYTAVASEGEAHDARYIVYLPSPGSRAAALERLRELKAKGIDSFVLGGALNNAISLGVFSQRESAMRLMAEMETRGYAVKLSSQERETPTYWLELGPKNSGRLSEALAQAVQRRYPEAHSWDRPCP